jgi:DNA-binding NarL/FixJ family response regulator
VRVILADDAAVIRHGLARLLAEEGVEIAAEVGDADALLEAVERDPPDAVIVDIRMPPTFSSEGLEAARAIRERHPGVGVLVLSQHIDTAYAMKLVTEGAERVGYLLKDRIADVAALAGALARVHAGETVVDPALVGELLDAPRARIRSPSSRRASARCSRWWPRGGRTAASPRRCGSPRRPWRRTCARSSASSTSRRRRPRTGACTQSWRFCP